jgi:hypothetical protein
LRLPVHSPDKHPLWANRQLSELERFVIEDYAVDLCHFYADLSKDVVKALLLIQYKPKIDNAFDVLVEALFSRMFILFSRSYLFFPWRFSIYNFTFCLVLKRIIALLIRPELFLLPKSNYPRTYYSFLLIELCKARTEHMPGIINICFFIISHPMRYCHEMCLESVRPSGAY